MSNFALLLQKSKTRTSGKLVRVEGTWSAYAVNTFQLAQTKKATTKAIAKLTEPKKDHADEKSHSANLKG